MCRHGPINSGIFHANFVKLVLDDIEEACPLREDHDLGFRVSTAGFEDADESLRLTALRLNIDVPLFDFFLLGFRGNETFHVGELCAAHRAFVLQVDGTLYAFSSKDMLASCYNRIMQLFETDGAFISTINTDLEKELESCSILVVKCDKPVLPHNGEKISDTGASELPMTAHLT